jgi:tryptophan-rich sensory protein
MIFVIGMVLFLIGFVVVEMFDYPFSYIFSTGKRVGAGFMAVGALMVLGSLATLAWRTLP